MFYNFELYTLKKRERLKDNFFNLTKIQSDVYII